MHIYLLVSFCNPNRTKSYWCIIPWPSYTICNVLYTDCPVCLLFRW